MKKILFPILTLLIVICGCSRKDLTYFNNLGDGTYTEEIQNRHQPVIQPDDLLSISVNSLNPEANAVFNSGELPGANSGNTMGTSRGTSTSAASSNAGQGYLVDQQGDIRFPVLGKIAVGGLTTTEAKLVVEEKLQSYLKEPVVNIRFLNFQITVIGEVKNPTTFTVPTEKFTVIEALGMAGDMTPFGKRENVLVIREEKGERVLTRLNLNDRATLQSPYFYLQQNDVVYVEPNSAKVAQSSAFRSDLTLILSIVSLLSITLYRFF